MESQIIDILSNKKLLRLLEHHFRLGKSIEWFYSICSLALTSQGKK